MKIIMKFTTIFILNIFLLILLQKVNSNGVDYTAKLPINNGNSNGGSDGKTR
jgi:hypothetical protein